MKRLLLLAGLIIFGATLAFAHGPGFARGMWGGYQQGYGMGMMGPQFQNRGYNSVPYQQNFGPGFCMGYGQKWFANANGISEKEAKNLVSKILKENFKGYKIKEVEKFRMPMGTMYEVDVVDAAGNRFEFHVNPFGAVMGPFPDNYDKENDND
ncbi:PepSY domain-containing protein [Deferribacter autotrophicus]|uniref:PepSY domain-containing protein n=1 Tax=Deferribacter autotrophicus TaxID=500465 RepID=A0A5A8F0R0_9BACT|nr:PepSY domain-containing protein [Deferribacter autotrophicus]KAA0257183.1 PepSY domain-containing protein [Deferribacter autotrophicus]